MERGPKETQQTQPETIRLGQRFVLFKPERTLEDHFGFRSRSAINLIERSSIIRISVLASRLERREYGSPSRYLHPFSPNEGYQITQEDFDLQALIEKHRMLDVLGDIPTKKYLVPWFNSLRDDETLNSNLYTESVDKKRFKPEILDQLKKIRLQLFFSTITYEGRPNVGMLENGHITIWQFLPPGVNFLPFNDLSIAVPEEKLYQIEGQFLPAQKQEEG